ncbi:MAG: tetratricopeptide repeat protein [Acidobacteriota bacterium]|nr:tetratricopeptide repeat protein [Acidobacteriota bacterium]
MKPTAGTDPGGGYGAREVSRMLGLSVAHLRAWVRSGLLEPERGPRGELKFSPEDLTLLRAARGLAGARIGPRRIERALSRLREQMPPSGSLDDLEISADGNRIVATDGSARWHPESGQILMDFAAIGGECVPLVRKRDLTPFGDQTPSDTRPSSGARGSGSAGDWYERGCALEEADAAAAEDAYRRAITLDPTFADAHVNVGRLRHEAGDAAGAEFHYRQALAARPDDATAAFDLGVALEDLRRDPEAIEAYERAVELDPTHADAFFNLAGACERAGRAAAAIRYLKAYRALTRSRSQ